MQVYLFFELYLPRMIKFRVLVFWALSALCCFHVARAQSIREKAAQMIVAGFRGISAPDSSQVAHWVRDLGIGGVIYFDVDVPTRGRRNVQSPEQLRRLSAQLQRLASTPLFITIDQEGGGVSRLKQRYGFPRTVSAKYLGSENDPESTRRWAAQTAATLRRAGINVDFAPVVDVDVDPRCPVIGARGRSFSADTAVVTSQAGIWIEQLHAQGILTSLKHFPGHGSSSTDSHRGLTDITQTWQPARELAPYRALFGTGYDDFVMVGHLVHREIDPHYPASLSHRWIDSVLRRELGFGGLVITDDLNMGAIVDHYSLQRALELSINAGVDLVILGNNGPVYEPDLCPRALELIVGLVESGRIPPARIHEAYARIMALKKRLANPQTPPHDDTKQNTTL